MNTWRVPDLKTVRLFHHASGSLCLTIAGDPIWSDVQVLRAAPLSDPDHYISVLDSDGNEIVLIDDPSQLDVETRRVLDEEMERRYLTLNVLRVHSARSESGVCHFDLETDRGRREVVVPNIYESARRLCGGRLLVVDVDGNRIEFPATTALDKRSATLLEATLS